MKKDLLIRIKNGDISAFNELYKNFKVPAIKFCHSIINNWEESENLIQEVFIKIWEKREGINPELNFNSYLFTIIRNRVYDHLKRVKRNEFIKEQYWQTVLEYQNIEPELKNERISLIKFAINGLTEKRKKIIHLNYEEGKSYEEIANLMNISKNTVKNQLVKAKHIIRTQTRFA